MQQSLNSLTCSANVLFMIALWQWSAPNRLTPATSLPSLLVRSSGRKSLTVWSVISGHLTEGLVLWCFPLKTGHLYLLVLWCRSHIKVLEDFGRTPGSVFPLIMCSTCGITRHFPFFFTEILFSRSMLVTLLVSLGLIFFFYIYSYWGIYWHAQFYIRFFSPHQIRLLVKACQRLCLAMSVRLLCPPPRVHWGLPLCPNPAAHLRRPQLRPQRLQARWDTENELF